MPLTFTFALSQQQMCDLLCHQGFCRLSQVELNDLINLCESKYYPQGKRDNSDDLIFLGKKLYQWLDGDAGWLRRALDETDQQTDISRFEPN